MARVGPKASLKRARAEMYRGLILEAAEVEFAAHGFDSAKMQHIAQGAGIALGTLYGVFPGKTEIYDAVQELRGREILGHIAAAIQGHSEFPEVALRGIEAYVRYLVEHPHYLQMHVREGLSWTSREVLRSGEQVATWEQGIKLATTLLKLGIERGLLHADNAPELQIKMLIAVHQVQLRDWLDRGADNAEVPALLIRMQEHFLRAFVRECEAGRDAKEAPRRASG
jgi:AcrR family transcriptional regulator